MIRFILLILFSSIISVTSYCQVKELTVDSLAQLDRSRPQFKGGDEALFLYLRKNFNVPFVAREHNIQGKVWSSVQIDSTGHVVDITILQTPHFVLSEASKEVIQFTTGMWHPAIDESGRPINSAMNIPCSYYIYDFDGNLKPINPSNLDSVAFHNLRETDVVVHHFKPRNIEAEISEALEANDYEIAKELLDEQYRGNPADPQVLHQKAEIHWLMEEKKDACKYWKKAAKFGNEAAQQKLEEHCND